MGQQLHGPVWPGELDRADHQAQEGGGPGRSRYPADLSRDVPQPGVDSPAQRQVSHHHSEYTDTTEGNVDNKDKFTELGGRVKVGADVTTPMGFAAWRWFRNISQRSLYSSVSLLCYSVTTEVSQSQTAFSYNIDTHLFFILQHQIK